MEAGAYDKQKLTKINFMLLKKPDITKKIAYSMLTFEKYFVSNITH